MDKPYEVTSADNNIKELISTSADLIRYARSLAAKQVNLVQLMTYYSLGRWIVEVEQKGQARAKYGRQVIRQLADGLTEEFGRGFSKANLEFARRFYLTYKDRIAETVFRQFAVQKTETVFRQLSEDPPFTVSWSHYIILMRIENEDERSFYEIEAAKSGWSVRTLQRQYGSSLYERLALSRDKDEVIRLAKEGNVIEKPQDIVKQPTVLEFLGLEEKASYSESTLESALIDLKTDKLTHQDLGQMQMYVNYYDRYEKLPDENPTVGILLCNEKSDAMVEITLPKDSNIYASEYELYLPDKKLLQRKLQEWIAEEEG